MIKINLNFRQYLELEKLGFGSFLPVKDFMKKKEVLSVVNNQIYRKKIFPLPIILDIEQNIAEKIKTKTKVINLFYKKKLVGKIFNPEIFSLKKKEVAKKIFGTSSKLHPGVNFFYNQSNFFVGGKTKFIQNVKNFYSRYEIKPEQSKYYFKKNLYKKIVGFQTRNVPHKAHEYLIRNAIENYDCIFIQPLLGEKKIGDYSASAIMDSFKFLIKKFYNKKKIILASLTTFMRYAGPREALFHAIIRKNYGCTHFIVGRDHAGVSNFYKKYEAQDYVKKFEKKIGISIIYSTGPFYCKKCELITTEKVCPHKDKSSIIEISGTYIRKVFAKGIQVDKRFINEEMVEKVINKNKNRLFIQHE